MLSFNNPHEEFKAEPILGAQTALTAIQTNIKTTRVNFSVNYKLNQKISLDCIFQVIVLGPQLKRHASKSAAVKLGGLLQI